MPRADGWRKVTLGEVADVSWGDTSTTKASYTDTGFPAYSASGQDGYLPYSDFDRLGVILSAIGANCGKTWLAKGQWSCIKNTIRFWSTDAAVDTEFLYWKTRNSQIWPKRGSAQPFISQGDARALQLKLPPLPEQRAIAHILGTLDDKIELNRRMNQTLDEMARALFKSWFLDFDPVLAKAALKQHALGNHAGPNAEPNGSGAAPASKWTVERARMYLDVMDPQVVNLFPDRLVDSEQRKIPEGWEVKGLGELVKLNSESWSRTNRPAYVEYIDLANTKWGVIEATQDFLWRDAPSRAKRVIRTGDTIVGTVRPGNGSYSFIGRNGLTASTGFAVLRPNHPKYRELVYLAATIPSNIERLAHMADGAAYPAVRPEVVCETDLAIPNAASEPLHYFSNFAGSILDSIESTKAESLDLAAQRDALLPRLVSGETRIVENNHAQ